MCCQDTTTLNLPPAVIEALAHYRRLLEERGWDWGDEQLPDFFRWARFSLLGPLFEAVDDTGDWARAIRLVIGGDVPPGIIVVRIDERRELRADLGETRVAIPGHTVPVDVVIDSAVDDELSLSVAGREVSVAPLGAGIETIDLDEADPVFHVALGDQVLRVEGAVRTSAVAELRLSSPDAHAGRSRIPPAGRGSLRMSFPSGTSITGLSSTATT
jgi:hypothetical protein